MSERHDPPRAAVGAAKPRYAAFLSYRHVEPDRGWAKWLHASLESWRTPAPLAKARGLPRRLGRVFRDEEEMAAQAHLPQAIDEALVASDALVVVCSPRTPVSQWVEKEVVRFRELGRADRILALLVEGDPATSFPRPLREIRAGWPTDEPLAADVRPDPSERPRHVRRMARLKLLAALLGCEFDDLRRREQERRTRRLAVAGVTLCTATAVFGGLAAYAFHQRDRANQTAEEEAESRERAEGLASFMLFDLRDRLQDVGRLDLLRAVAQRAQAYYDSLPARHETAQARFRRAVALSNLGLVFDAQGDHAAAEAAFRGSLEASETRADADPDRRAHVAIALRHLGSNLATQGKLASAEESYRRALEITKALAPGSPLEGQAAVDASGDLTAIARIERTMGRDAEAEQVMTEALAVLAPALRGTRTPVGWKRNALVVRYEMSQFRSARGDLDGAIADTQDLLREWDALASERKDSAAAKYDAAIARSDLGDLLLSAGRSREALALLRRALEVREELTAFDPTNVAWAASVASSRMRVAEIRSLRGDLRGCLDDLRTARAEFEVVVVRASMDPSAVADLAAVESRIASVLAETGDLPGAVTARRSALTRYRALAAKNPDLPANRAAVADEARALARLVLRTGDVAGATALRAEARTVGAVGPIAAVASRGAGTEAIRVHLAEADRRALTGDLRGALASCDATCRLLRGEGLPALPLYATDEHGVPKVPERAELLAAARRRAATAYLELRRYEEALGALREVAAVFGHLTRLDPDRIDWLASGAEALENLGVVSVRRDEDAEAAAFVEEALRMRRRVAEASPDSLDAKASLATARGRYGASLGRRGQVKEGRIERRAAVALLEEVARAAPADLERVVAVAAECIGRGKFESDAGAAGESLDADRRAVGLLEPLVAAHPDHVAWRRALSSAYASLGWDLHVTGDEPGATEVLAKAAELDLRDMADEDVETPK